VDWKKYAEIKKGMACQVERESYVDGLFAIVCVLHHESLC
jgi:hypothetical protein